MFCLANNLSVVARDVSAQLARLAINKQQTLALDAPQAAPVLGDAALPSPLVRNLLDNALRYTRPSSRVHVYVLRSATGVELPIEDSGLAMDAQQLPRLDAGQVLHTVWGRAPAMDAQQLRRLGERFYRVLGSNEPGSGLGWSTVHRIAATHSGVVTANRSTLLGTLAASVRFPAPSRLRECSPGALGRAPALATAAGPAHKVGVMLRRHRPWRYST